MPGASGRACKVTLLGKKGSSTEFKTFFEHQEGSRDSCGALKFQSLLAPLAQLTSRPKSLEPPPLSSHKAPWIKMYSIPQMCSSKLFRMFFESQGGPNENSCGALKNASTEISAQMLRVSAVQFVRSDRIRQKRIF